MKYFILKFLLLATLVFSFSFGCAKKTTSMANSEKQETADFVGDDDPGPFPWRVCEFPLNNMYGIWAIQDNTGSPQYLIKISSITKDKKSHTIAITKYAYSPDYKGSLSRPIATGVGILSKNKLEFIAQMQPINGNYKKSSYILYFMSFCDDQGRRRHEVLETPFGGPAKHQVRDIMIRQKTFD